MFNESAMEKWFKIEILKINSGLVTKKASLLSLAAQDSPYLVTMDNSQYHFDENAISSLIKRLPSELHSLLLPISLYVSSDVVGFAYIAERKPLDALKHIKEVSKDADLIDGRYWIAKASLWDMMKRWPTIFQMVRLF